MKESNGSNNHTSNGVGGVCGPQDVFMMVRKDNRKLLFVVILNSISILILAFLVLYLKDPRIKILRMYDNPALNETAVLDSSTDNRIRKQDIMLLAKFIVEHLDLKSSNAVGNLAQLLNVSEGQMLKDLQEHQDRILTDQNTIDQVYNTVIATKIDISQTKRLFFVAVKYKQVVVLKDGIQSESMKEVHLALKPVDRQKYSKNLNLGGWYYGLMLVQINVPLDNI